MTENYDFQFAQQGLLIPQKDPIVNSESDPSVVVWNSDAFAFMQDDCPSTANKMLWRQGQLCSVTAGLYQVVDGIYQARGLDISNMTFIRIPTNPNQIVIIDCLTSAETAKRGLELYQEYHVQQLGQEAEIVALFYTHSHGDHFGGAQAVVDKAGPDLRIIAPDGFLQHAVSENIYAGVVMGRRSIYMYGQSLDPSPVGCIGCGLGQSLSTGTNTLIKPTENVKVDGPLLPKIDGLQVICQLTPGTEAPSEMNFFFPDYSALCAAENATHTMHNIQTLRGAQVRDARMWSRYLDETIALFGDKVRVVFASHHWPTWNQDDQNLAVTFLSQQRDMYAYLHNETVRQFNKGLTPVEIGETIKLPPSLADKTNLQGFYGSVNHNVKAVYDKYLGWFDGNPANLHPHTPTDEATRFVDCLGGSAAAYQKANDYYSRGDLRFAATLLNKLVFADPSNGDARNLLSTVYTQMGQASENGTWRNIYLVGAQELIQGPQPAYDVISQESLASLSLDELFDTLAIRIDGPKAGLQDGVTIDFMIDDMVQQAANPGAGWHCRMSNGAVTGRATPYVAYSSSFTGKATLTVWLKHADLTNLIGAAALGQAASLDGFNTSGDVKAWTTICQLVTLPDTAFNIVIP
ncbi:Alkyl/aryl-sulfatase BDS1 [Escovopsis weberi]|uniref:Alkyl/aryl-sulfatase BDS1 n=1 Tax=Escovopsis weberi TaxID=150374 RepID=A0A0M8N1S2_ESCWE|nr:Alkyl/aryl-sulfatase BDS1 [Escovopsis weberi]